MELADYLKILRRRWWMILLAVVLCMAGAAGITLTETPRYTSATRLLVGGAAQGADNEDTARSLAAKRASAYSELIQTGPGLAIAGEQSGALASHPAVTAVADGAAPFITITVVADTPEGAQAMAAAYEKAIPEIVRRLEKAPASAIPTLTTLEPAYLPAAPTSPQPMQDLPIAALVGLVLGFAAALLREALDARVRDTAELEKLTKVTLLGAVPREHAAEALPAARRPRSGRAEAYRHVRTNLEFAGASGMPASLAITSAGPGEGKSSLAANLAVAAAHAGRQVVIIDADLRKPTQHKYFGLTPQVGLSEVLAGHATLDQAMVPLQGERITVLPSGSVPTFPSELVGSARMVEVLEELERRFDLVIVDTPPVLPVSDALVVGVHVEGVVLVARMVETRRAALKKAVESVQKVNARVLGVVGNAVVRQEEKGYGYGYGYGYGSKKVDNMPLPAELAPAPRRVEPAEEPVDHVVDVDTATVQPRSRREGRRALRTPEPAPHPSPAQPPYGYVPSTNGRSPNGHSDGGRGVSPYPTISAQAYVETSPGYVNGNGRPLPVPSPSPSPTPVTPLSSGADGGMNTLLPMAPEPEPLSPATRGIEGLLRRT